MLSYKKVKRFCVYFLVLLFCVAIVTLSLNVQSVSIPRAEKLIVIDAGHGGEDGGAVGKSGTTESFLNLEYAKELDNLLTKAGYKTVMTRKDMAGLYSPMAKNKKRSEMEAREKIISLKNVDIVVSLHMNSFPLSSSSGAQAFFKAGNEKGEALASSIQKEFISSLPNARQSALQGDYYVLNCTDKPAVLVECGFLSNEEEEKNLCDETYRKRFCEILVVGIMNFQKL